jgi:hypothetical protein
VEVRVVAATKRKRNLAPTPRSGSGGYDVVIGARRKHFESHTAAHRYGTDQQNKGVHAEFVIVDSATGKRERFKRSGARNKKRNPEAGAVAMRESFTGLPSKRVEVVSEEMHVHSHLAALGELIELKVKTVKGENVIIAFTKEQNPQKRKSGFGKIKGWVDRRGKAVTHLVKGFTDAWVNPRKMNPNGPVLLCSTEDGKHLYIEGGDQSLDLGALGLGELKGKESAVIGTVTHVTYHAQKKFDGKVEEYDYFHRFSEESNGLRPMLRYDIRNEHLYLDGGVYRIPRPLMGTSQGITD